MKRGLIISILLGIILVVVKYYVADYSINYKVNNYDIKTTYKDKRLYYEIRNKDEVYNFDIYMKRKLSKTKIDKIKIIEGDTFKCLYPTIKNVKTYPLCYENGIYKDYNLIESELLIEYKEEIVNVEKTNKDFVYHNILTDGEYVALWNYKGYIVMNGQSFKNVELFKKDKYDNSLAYLMNDTIYMANYNEEHEYSKLISLNLKTLKKKEIIIGYNIDYDSYIVGHIKKKLYIFDNKHSKLYEIDLKKEKTSIIASSELGYKKYNGEEFVKCSKSEYKVDKITFNTKESVYDYKYNEGIYKTIPENKQLKQLIHNSDIQIETEFQNKLYYALEDNFYIYTPESGSKLVFYNYELSFNNKNTIFVYIDN